MRRRTAACCVVVTRNGCRNPDRSGRDATVIHARRLLCIVLGALALVAFAVPPAHAVLIGPIRPYESFADSPWAALSFTYFHLETYEESGAPANSPGVT